MSEGVGKFSKMDQMQIIAVHAVMAQHCRRGDNGYAVYEEGWSDERVHGEVVNPELQQRSVQYRAPDGRPQAAPPDKPMLNGR